MKPMTNKEIHIRIKKVKMLTDQPGDWLKVALNLGCLRHVASSRVLLSLEP